MKCFCLFILSLLCCSLAAQSECNPTGYTGEKKTKDEEGRLIVENYQDGMKHGITTTYYLNGEERKKTLYKMGKLVEVVLQPTYAREQKEWDELAKRKKSYEPPPKSYSHTTSNYSYCGQTTGKPINYTKDSTKQLVTDCKQRILSEIIKWKGINSMWKNYDTLGRLISKTVITGKKQEEISFYESGKIKQTTHSAPCYNGTLSVTKVYSTEGELKRSEISRNRIKGLYTNYAENSMIRLFYEMGKLVKRIENSEEGETVINYLPDDPGIKRWVLCSECIGRETDAEQFYGARYFPSKNYRSGHFADGEFITDSIVDHFGSVLVKNGDGYYHGESWLVEASPAMLRDTIRHPEGTGYIMYISPLNWQYQDLQSGVPEYEQDKRLLIPQGFEYAKGSFKNGSKSGNWQFEKGKGSKSDSYWDLRYGGGYHVLSGTYEQGKRIGTWKYSNDCYTADLAYSNGICEQPQLQIKYPLSKRMEKELGEYGVADLKRTLYGGFGLGAFKNELLDGDISFYRYFPDTLICKLKFKEGRLQGYSTMYYRKNQVHFQNTFAGDTVCKSQYYSPEGDPIGKDSMNDYSWHGEYGKKVNGKYEGKYLKWNIYTGDIWEKGYYSNGVQVGQWEHYKMNIEEGGIYGKTVSNYSNGVLNGPYSDETRGYKFQAISGTYSNNKKEGLWKTTDVETDTIYTEEMFDEGQRFLLYYSLAGKTCVKNGFGSVPSFNNVTDLKTEDFYENGRYVKTVNTYTISNHVESIVYKTKNGDSLAYYDPKGGGTCIKNGTGARSYLDANKVLHRVDHYEKGKLVKIDSYHNGIFDHTSYMYSSTDSVLKSGRPVLHRQIEPVAGTEENLYKVTCTIYNIRKDYKNFKLNFGMEIYNPDLIDTSFFRPLGNPKDMTFYHAQSTSENQVHFSFYVRLYNNYYMSEELFSAVCFYFTADNRERWICLNANTPYHPLPLAKTD